MTIYFALLIPIITALVLYIFFKYKTVWWEFIIPIAASFIFVVLMKLIIETSQVKSKEYWGSFISRIEYYEDWDEEVHCRHSYDCNCSTDRKGNRSCSTCYMHAYDVDYHPPYWQLVTTTGETVGIDKAEYSCLEKSFANSKFIELNRSYHSKNGNEYFCKWIGDSIRAVPVTTVHSYENRIKVSDQSVFHFQKVDTSDIKRFGLKDYPSITGEYTQDALIGCYDADAQLANKKLQYINGFLGPRKQAKVFVLVFRDKPIEAGLYQEWYWSGANKNEMIICIGVDNAKNVKWCHPISWTTNETLKAQINQFVIDQNKLNLSALADYMQVQMNKGFVRRSFKEFDYLTVEPPTWAIVLTYILTLLINVGLSAWIITNEFEENGESEIDESESEFGKSFTKRWRYLVQWLSKK